MDDQLLSFSVYKPRYGGRLNPSQCAAGCYGERVTYWQCSKKGHLAYGGHLWCSTHFPPNVKKREDALAAKRQTEAVACNAHWKQVEMDRKQKEAALEACRRIAEGHDDPRSLARAVMELNRPPK